MNTNSHLKVAGALAGLALVSTLHAGIAIHGSTTAYQETGGDWLTMGTNDIDGSGGLGTDGFFFFGNFNGVQQNAQPFSHHVKSPLPSYLTGYAQGANWASAADEFAGYGSIDNPILLNGTNGLGGVGLASGGGGNGAGSSQQIMTFTIAALPAGTTVRVGVLGGVEGTADGRWDPTSITLSDGTSSATVGVHGTSSLPASPGGTNTGWVFFDIDADGVYAVSATKRLAGQGAGIGGLTFDSSSGANPDSDGDNILDWWELAKTASPGNLVDLNGLLTGPGPGSNTGDFDGDGLTDLEEFNLAVTTGTYPNLNPTLFDTDGDGLSDGAEVNGTPPTSPTNPDTDGDGLSDKVETNTGTYVDANNTGSNPTNPDSDGDGFPDGLEVTWGGDPNVFATSLPNATFGYTEVGGDWLTMGTHDIDGSGGLGSDGFLFFGNFTGTQVNGQPYTLHVESKPSYLISHAPGADFASVASGFAAYGRIDDPNLLNGTDQIAGFVVASGGGVGSVREVMTFEIGGLAPGQVVRVGMLGGVEGTASGVWDPTELILSGPGGYLKGGLTLEINPGGVNAGWLFFDIDTEGTYTVSGKKRAAGQGCGIGGLTFDSIGGGIKLAVANAANGTDLDFVWNSRAGWVYRLVSSTTLDTAPSTWTPVAGYEAMASTAPTNMLTIPRPSGDPKTFYAVQELPIPPVFEDGFEAGQGGWTTGVNDANGNTLWQIGAPSNVGPATGAGGSASCFGTNLAADYAFNADIWLRSPMIDLTTAPSARLTFQQFVDVEGQPFDYGVIRVLDADNADSELAVVVPSVVGMSVDWASSSVFLPAEALGKRIKLEFRLISDDLNNRAGWYIDAVQVFVP